MSTQNPLNDRFHKMEYQDYISRIPFWAKFAHGMLVCFGVLMFYGYAVFVMGVTP